MSDWRRAPLPSTTRSSVKRADLPRLQEMRSTRCRATTQLRKCRRRPLVQTSPDRCRTLRGRSDGGVDLKVVDPGIVDRPLPTEDDVGDRSVGPAPDVAVVSTGFTRIPAVHDHLDGTSHADEIGGEIDQLLRRAPENPQGLRVVVVMSDIDDHVEPQPAESHDRCVESVEEQGEVPFEVGPVPAGTQTDSRQQLGGGDVLAECIDAEAQPRSIGGILDRPGNGRFARSRDTIENDDDPGVRHTHISAQMERAGYRHRWQVARTGTRATERWPGRRQ